MATIVPSRVCPLSKRFALVDASNIEAKSSSGSLTALSSRLWLRDHLYTHHHYGTATDLQPTPLLASFCAVRAARTGCAASPVFSES
jgi:hypothetical protein